ncbi:hypothetical protein EON64_02870 [archaeon]|nr:MAG: hypothetical protein EON64_02870 [archaeon]
MYHTSYIIQVAGTSASEDALFPTMITLGAEAGQDVAALSGYEGDWLHTAMSAESLALVVVNIIGKIWWGMGVRVRMASWCMILYVCLCVCVQVYAPSPSISFT